MLGHAMLHAEASDSGSESVASKLEVTASAVMWAAVTGNCTLDGACVQSPNYPQDYGNNERCTLQIDKALSVPIRVERFKTESAHDYLIVNGKHYSGSAGPNDITPTASISWTTDSSVVKSGWRLCAAKKVATTTTTTETVHCTPDHCDFDCPNVDCMCMSDCSGFLETRVNLTGKPKDYWCDPDDCLPDCPNECCGCESYCVKNDNGKCRAGKRKWDNPS